MTEEAGKIVWSTGLDMGGLDRDMRTVEQKIKDARRRIESSPILQKLKIDDQSLRQAQDAIQRAFNSKPVKLRLDTSEAEKQIANLKTRIDGALGGRLGSSTVTSGTISTSGVGGSVLASGYSAATIPALVQGATPLLAGFALTRSAAQGRLASQAHQAVESIPNYMGVVGTVETRSCPNCGKLVPANGIFCPVCGADSRGTRLARAARGVMAGAGYGFRAGVGGARVGIGVAKVGFAAGRMAGRAVGAVNKMLFPDDPEATLTDIYDRMEVGGVATLGALGEIRDAIGSVGGRSSSSPEGFAALSHHVRAMRLAGIRSRRRGGGGSYASGFGRGGGGGDPFPHGSGRYVERDETGTVTRDQDIRLTPIAPSGGTPVRWDAETMARAAALGLVTPKRIVSKDEMDALLGDDLPDTGPGGGVGAMQQAWLPNQITPWLLSRRGIRRRAAQLGPMSIGSYGDFSGGPMGPSMANGNFFSNGGWGGSGMFGRAGYWARQPMGGALGRVGITNGMAVGAGVYALAHVGNRIGNIQEANARGYAYARSMEVDPAWSKFDPDAAFEAGKTSFDRFLPGERGADRAERTALIKMAANERAAEERRDIRFQAHRRTAGGRSYARQAVGDIAALNIDDEYGNILTQANADFTKVEEDIALNGQSYGPQKAYAMMRQAGAQRSRTQRAVARSMRISSINSGLAVGQFNLTGFDDREAGRMGIQAGYTERLNSPTASVRAEAQAEMTAHLGMEERGYRRDTGFLGGRNTAAGFAARGYDYQAAIAGNRASFNEATAGLNRMDPLQNQRYLEHERTRQIADAGAARQLDLSRRDIADSTRMAHAGMMGTNAGAITDALNQARATAIARSPEQAAQINAQFDQQIAQTRIGDIKSQAGYGLGTRGINFATNRQNMATGGHYIQAQAQSIIDDARQQIAQAGIDIAPGSSPDWEKRRQDRVDAIKGNASAQISGIKSNFRFSLTTENVGAYELLGGAGGRSELADKAVKDIQGLGGQLAQGLNGMNADAQQPNVGQPGANGAWSAQQVQQALEYFRRMAENIGVQ